MIYLFLGEPSPSKEQAITRLKNKLMPDPQARIFDYDALDGMEVGSAGLKQSLMALPALGPRRLVMIRNANKLKDNQQDLLAEFGADNPKVDVVLDWNSLAAKRFITRCGGRIRIEQSESGEKQNVFKMADLIPRRPDEALKILNGLYEDGESPLNILGGLVWYWGKHRSRFPGENYKKGLLHLQEADLRIKRSRVKPEQAVEMLVVKLCAL
jgi:DNA polymerase III delta subunit